jgi:RNA polymerase sigma-70 factor (ECF subfamily)
MFQSVARRGGFAGSVHPTMIDRRIDFPTTHWTRLEAVRGDLPAEHRAVLNCLMVRYWKPIHAFLWQRGYREEAADLTQEFFAHCLAKELFGRARKERGRFRTFLLACLKNFLVDEKRRSSRRRPPQGLVSIEQLAAADDRPFEPADNETPETAFSRAWVSALLRRVWKLVERDLKGKGQQVHGELFRRRILEPALGGEAPPQVGALAREYGLAEKEASNRLVTVQRAFRRALQQEIRLYAGSEKEVALETRDLFEAAAGRHGQQGFRVEPDGRAEDSEPS